jgi:hypothetical protein
MRIIDTDNFGGDYPNEKFHLFSMSAGAAQDICGILNAERPPDSDRWFRAVEDDYKLQPGFTP